MDRSSILKFPLYTDFSVSVYYLIEKFGEVYFILSLQWENRFLKTSTVRRGV